MYARTANEIISGGRESIGPARLLVPPTMSETGIGIIQSTNKDGVIVALCYCCSPHGQLLFRPPEQESWTCRGCRKNWTIPGTKSIFFISKDSDNIWVNLYDDKFLHEWVAVWTGLGGVDASLDENEK